MSVKTRVERLRALAAKKGYDAVVIRNNPDLRWLTGAERVFDFELAHTAFITQDKLYFHTDSRYYNTFIEKLGDETPWQFDMDDLSHIKFIVEKAKETHSRYIAIEDTMSLGFYSSLVRAAEDESLHMSFTQLHGDLVEMRAIKDAEEIEIMRQAQAITDKTFTHMLSVIEIGKSEKELQAELDNYMYSQGADALAFDTIVASGPNTANPHAMPGSRKVQAGDFVLMDYGAGYRDYCSDMTRTVVIGEPAEWQKEIYQIVKETNEACHRAAKPGIKGREIHELAVKLITEAGYGDYFKHGLGHGVGIDIHEQPCFGRSDNHTIAPGHVITIEPGIYLPGRGGVRIEDYGVITDDGMDIFTSSTHELQIL